MSQTIQEENNALVLEALDTLLYGRDYAAAESGTGVAHHLQLPI
jgi:hypothetical protein